MPKKISFYILLRQIMAKRTFLHTPYVKITNEYAIFNSSWKVDIKKVNAVFVTRQETNRRYPIISGISCLLIGVMSGLSFFFVSGFFCLVWLLLIKTRYTLRIKTGNGEIRPIQSTNVRELKDIKTAIEKAMFHEEEEEKVEQILLPAILND